MISEKTISGLQPSHFRQEVDGKETWLCALTNKTGSELTILNYGAKIVSLMVPDRDGQLTDVVTGHDSIQDYLASEEPYFGAVCGRYGNRIAKGRFTLDDVIYDRLAINNGPNNLHGGLKGFNAVVWDMYQSDSQTVMLTYTSPDGEEGFPGNLYVNITYYLSDDNAVFILYKAITDKPTVLNLTNHSYFNLSGAGAPSIDDHLLFIHADYYLPTDATAIPYGPKAKVEGTPMDFNDFQTVGSRINDDFEQLRFGRGYDHTYILKTEKIGEKSLISGENEFLNDKSLKICANLKSPKTGIVMNTFTTEPGVQLYTGNWMTGNLVGKHGQRYPMRSALCLETQHFPDSPNKPAYPSTILRPGDVFESQTVYKFNLS